MTDTYHLELLLGGQKWITSNQRLHWAPKSERVKAWRRFAAWRAVEENLPHLERAHIVAEFRFADHTRRDANNWAPTVKAVVDGLVDAGVFDDDDSTRLTGPDLRIGPVVKPAWRAIHLHIREVT